MSLSSFSTWTTYELIDDVLRVTAAVGAVTAAVIAYRANRQIQQVHISINSRMDALLKLTASASHAEGVEQQRIIQEQNKL